jgi:single-strand selective monofunctional uracil DNA glycosylase
MEEGGKNRTPDKLPKDEREALFAVCDRALLRTIDYLKPKYLVGVGAFAEDRIRQALASSGRDAVDVVVGRILHPSPASPAANRGWVEAMEKDLSAMGVKLPGGVEKRAAGKAAR